MCLFFIEFVPGLIQKFKHKFGAGNKKIKFDRDYLSNDKYNTTTQLYLFYHASHTQQKLVSRWGVGKHITVNKVRIYMYAFNIKRIIHGISTIQ